MFPFKAGPGQVNAPEQNSNEDPARCPAERLETDQAESGRDAEEMVIVGDGREIHDDKSQRPGLSEMAESRERAVKRS